MNTNGALWMVVSASLVLAAGRGAAGEPWRAVEQPELKEALEHAPTLQTESLGEPARGVNVWERWLVPNPDGKSWDVLQVYFKEYYGPTWLYAVDLGTGRVTKQRLADGHQFYLSGRALGFDGKYYIATPSRKTWSMDLFVYDPAANAVEERGEIVPGLGGEVRPLVTGPDGRIYGTGTRGNRVGLYIYDPTLGKVVKDFGPVGPTHPNGAWSRYVMGVDDTHAYIASGMIPAWYLVAVNLATGEEKVLLESPTERVMDIIERFPGAYVRVPQEGGAPNQEYWLYHGQALPKTNDTPPWPKQTSPWDKAVPKPQVYFDQIDPDAEGKAMLWYRLEKNAGWKSVRLEGVESYPHRLNPMSLLPDGRLYGTGDDYAGVFAFDPRTDQATILGPRPGLAPYTQIVCGGKLYSSGYSGGHLFVYDPERPWTLSKGGPPGQPAIDQADARSNPRYLGDFDKTTRVGLMHSSAPGADGRIYFGGFGLRHYTGGGFGWYDPKTEKMDGFWEPLSGYAVQWVASVLDGRLIAISTIRAADEQNGNRAPQEAKLFIYDVHERKIVRQIVPVRNGRTTGLIAEVAPGRLLGLTSSPQQSGRSILYGVDVTAGEVLFTKDLPSPVSVDAHWPHWVDPSYEYNAFVCGPDGFVWTYLKNVLVRIDPRDARVHAVGKIDPVGWPTFVGKDVYFSGPEQLRRIRNLVEHASAVAPTGAGLRFEQVVLDKSYIAYERDVGDIDGDGRNDVVAVMEGDTTVQVFHAPTWKRSTLVTFTGEYRYPRADDFKLADMDGDGDLDVVTRLGKGPADDGAGLAVWCENLGGGSRFVPHLIGSSLEYVKDIVVADFDRDGRPDVAMRMDSRTQLWLQEAGGTWTEVRLTHPAHEGMEAGDLDGDSDPDLIFNGYWFETPDTPAAARVAANYVYHVIDSAWFNQTGDWTKNSCKLVVGDFDGDGRNDVAFSHSERPGHAVAWYGSATPRVEGAWSKHPVAVVDFCHTLQAADFDLDGDVDLLVGGMIQSQHRGLRLMLNSGGGMKWTESVIQTDGSYSAELGDIGNDGDLDIVGIRNWNAAPTWIYRNDSTPRGDVRPQAISSRPCPWGVVQATLGDGPEDDGTILLENRAIRVRYTAKRFRDGNKDHVITDFLVKKTGSQLAVGDQLDGIWMNADEGRGRVTSARVTCDGPERKTLRVEWDEGKVVQEFTIWPDRPTVRIDYLKYGINIVDMIASVDTFEVYGAKPWQEARIQAANETLLNISNPHHRLTKDLYPRYPFPLLAGKDWEELEPKELTYRGHLILGAYQQETGLGFGRVFPAQDANYIKLLNMGFEVFANWRQPHRPFTSHLYAVTEGPDELMAVGKALVDAAGGPTADISRTNAAPYLAAVRQFADQALAHGRDTYGQPTPLFVDGLNVDTREPVKWKWTDGKEWVLCNLSSQQGLFRTLDGLSRLTGEPRYKDAALAALRYAFDHLRYGTQNNGGLLAWGGHLAYNATDDVIAGHPEGTGRTHELKCFFPHYELMWEADPQATRQLIENMWNGHVLDWARLDFNRHASPKKLGLLWRNEYRGGEVFFDGQGLTFHNAGSDFYFAAGMLSKLGAAPEPLVWAQRLCHRYVETRDPKTGLGGFQFSQSQSAWCDDVGKIRGDRAQYQYGADFPGHRVVEGTLFPCYGDTPEVSPQVGRLLLGEQLGEAGRDFTRWAVEELTAWGKSAYRQKDNAFIPMLTDGTSMEGYVCKKDGYFGPKGRVLRAGYPGAAHLWLYAWAFRLSRDAFLWEMARNIARGNGWGDIGGTPEADPRLRFPDSSSDPRLLMALLELHRAGGKGAFLAQAEVVGQSILKQRVRQGWFVPSQRHLFCRLSNNEAQALLHLAAVLLRKPESVPAFTGASPFFHAAYGEQTARSYDSSILYGKIRP